MDSETHPLSLSVVSSDSATDRCKASEEALWKLYESIVQHVEFTKTSDTFLLNAIHEASLYLESIRG